MNQPWNMTEEQKAHWNRFCANVDAASDEMRKMSRGYPYYHINYGVLLPNATIKIEDD